MPRSASRLSTPVVDCLSVTGWVRSLRLPPRFRHPRVVTDRFDCCPANANARRHLERVTYCDQLASPERGQQIGQAAEIIREGIRHGAPIMAVRQPESEHRAALAQHASDGR
jgi:hypothetical protein